jgi:hypothetical protein
VLLASSSCGRAVDDDTINSASCRIPCCKWRRPVSTCYVSHSYTDTCTCKLYHCHSVWCFVTTISCLLLHWYCYDVWCNLIVSLLLRSLMCLECCCCCVDDDILPTVRAAAYAWLLGAAPNEHLLC